MSIGGDSYKKILRLLEAVEQAIHSGQDFKTSLAELDLISELFRMNHKISFDFLSSHEISKKEKLHRLSKIMMLLYKLDGLEEARLKASEELSKYR